MSRIYEIANEYVERYAALDPIGATSMGIPGHDEEMTDFSPDGAEARAALDRQTLATLSASRAGNQRDRVAREVMVERRDLQLALYEAAEPLRDLNVIASPVQRIRTSFDLMPRATEGDWRNIAARMRLVPDGLAGLCAAGRRSRGGNARRCPAGPGLRCTSAGVEQRPGRGAPLFPVHA